MLFALILHFLHWCYSLTALLSANQNQVIFSCMLLYIKHLLACSQYAFGDVTLRVRID